MPYLYLVPIRFYRFLYCPSCKILVTQLPFQKIKTFNNVNWAWEMLSNLKLSVLISYLTSLITSEFAEHIFFLFIVYKKLYYASKSFCNRLLPFFTCFYFNFVQNIPAFFDLNYTIRINDIVIYGSRSVHTNTNCFIF